jgi:hypothetical protein
MKKITANLPAKGQSIKRNIRQSLDRVRSVPATQGSGIVENRRS